MKFRTGEPTTERPSFGMIIKNPGRNVATIQEFSASPYLGPLPDELKNINIDLATRSVAPGHQITLQGKISNPNVFTEEVVRKLLNGEESFCAYGHIRYYDVYSFLLGPSETGYCFCYVPPRQRYEDDSFEACKNPKYTYTR
jgi:hypothetical protein